MIIFHSFSFFSPWQEKVSADGVAAQDAPQEAPNQDVWRARDRKGGLTMAGPSSVPFHFYKMVLESSGVCV